MLVAKVSPEIYVGLSDEDRFKSTTLISSLDFETIAKKVSSIQDVKLEDIHTRSRLRKIVMARMIIIHFSLQTGKYTLKALGKILKLDYSTIIYNRDQLSDLMSTDKDLKIQVDLIQKALYRIVLRRDNNQAANKNEQLRLL